MAWVFAVPVMGFLVFLAVGAITGTVKVKSCCGISDPRCDARMRDAFETERTPPSPRPPDDRSPGCVASGG